MSQFTDRLCGIATEWRTRNQEHQSGVVLVWQGSVYGWKDCLRDATHERPGVYAVDEDGHVFLAEGGNDYDGAKCWVVVSPDAPAPLVFYAYRCAGCGHAGQVHLMEFTAEVTTACSACGSEVIAEWDGGVEMTTTPP